MKALGCLLFAICVSGRGFAQPTLQLQIQNGPVAALMSQNGVCNGRDLPDTPARAIRLENGAVQLYATDRENRVDVGPDLLHLTHRCPIVFHGAGNDDPAAYDDRAWIASPWTSDGRVIWAVVHNEFHGHLRPALCPTKRYMDCWFNALVLVVSHDGGRHYERAADALVATLPYRFDQVGLGHHGYFNPSNIVSIAEHHYMFVFATRTNAQRNGNCLLRTDTVERASAWRGWDGTGFTVEFVDPYKRPVKPERHVCAPIDVEHLRWPVTSLVRHAPTGLFIALMQNTAPGGGVFYATSPDLVHWSEPASLLPMFSVSAWRCGSSSPIAYPSLLDPASNDRNFATVGAQLFLFATVFDVEHCKFAGRRLVRWTVTVEPYRTVSRK